MSITLPSELVVAIGLVGLPWPEVDEDQLRGHADHLRAFASSLSDTHDEAHARISALSASNAGAAYEAMVERWAHVSSTHMHELIEGCHALATALEAAAEAVVVAKTAILAALDQLEQMAVAEALELAIGPLEDKLAVAVQGMVLRGAESALA